MDENYPKACKEGKTNEKKKKLLKGRNTNRTYWE